MFKKFLIWWCGTQIRFLDFTIKRLEVVADKPRQDLAAQMKTSEMITKATGYRMYYARHLEAMKSEK